MGELNESIHDDLAAGQNFARAAEYFKEDGNSEASATKCLLKVADYAAMDKQYAKAIEIYEEVSHRLGCIATQFGSPFPQSDCDAFVIISSFLWDLCS